MCEARERVGDEECDGDELPARSRGRGESRSILRPGDAEDADDEEDESWREAVVEVAVAVALELRRGRALSMSGMGAGLGSRSIDWRVNVRALRSLDSRSSWSWEAPFTKSEVRRGSRCD